LAESGERALGRPAAEGGPPSLSTGPGRVLVGLYGLFALAAGARAGVQIATKFAEAPVAYLLSALAAAIYLVATVGLIRGGRGGRRTAFAAISIELAGVLVVGTLSLIDPAAFPDETVWSTYGRGYGFIPLALPVLGLLWLREQRRPDG
jgi:cytochrome bd-type quinol oxidase subunit 2